MFTYQVSRSQYSRNVDIRTACDKVAREWTADYEGTASVMLAGKFCLFAIDGENVGHFAYCGTCDKAFPVIGGNIYDEVSCQECGAVDRKA